MRNEVYVAALFGLIGIGGVLAGIYTYIKGLLIASGWSTTTGRVNTSELIVSQGSRIRKSGYVVFEYLVDGQKYSSATVTTNELLKITGMSEEEANKRMTNYPVGATVQVFYDPSDPKRAVLEKVGDFSLAILGGIFIIFALAFYFI